MFVICSSYVQGPPSAPTINLTTSADFQLFTMTISMARLSARCVRYYSPTIIENGGPMTTITSRSSGTGSVGG